MRRIARLLTRFMFDAVTRRAIDETIADWAHATHGRSHWSRLRLSMVTAVALVRVVSSGLALGSEEHPMRDLGRELKYAVRRLRRSPAFTVFAVATLAIGIGATTAVYSVVRAALGPPPGVPNLGRILNVSRITPSRTGPVRISLADYEDLRRWQQSFEKITAFSSTSAAFAADGQSAAGYLEFVDGDYFSVVGLHAAAGRLLQPSDDSPEAPIGCVIGSQFRQKLFPDGQDAVGRVIRINGHAVQVVGIVPDDFRGLRVGGLVRVSVWVPLRATTVLLRAGAGSPTIAAEDRSQGWLMVKGLLKAGVSLEQGRTEVEHLSRQLDQVHAIVAPDPSTGAPVQRAREWTGLEMTGLASEMPSEADLAGGLGAALIAAVIAVLLVACTNLANLTLARGTARLHEHAVRRALGSSRWRLVRQLLLESLIVVGAGVAGGIALARMLTHIAAGELTVSGTIATLGIQPRLDAAVIAVSAAAAALAVIVTGLWPALQSTRGSVRTAIVPQSAGSPPWRARRVLIVAQVATSVVLLALTAVSVQELRRQATSDTGVDLDRLAAIRINFAMQGYDAPRAYEILSAIRSTMLRSPDVESASIATAAPVFATPGVSRFTTITGSESHSSVIAGTADLIQPTLGIELRHGAIWSSQTRGPVCVVSESTANDLFGTTRVAGERILRWRGDSSEELQIVGVSADTRGDDERERQVVYVPLDATMDGWTTLPGFIIVRTKTDPAEMLPAIRQAVAAIDPGLAISTSGTGRALAGGSTAEFYSITASLAGGLGTCAWLLALAGLYGVLSHLVLHRRREIGLRMALGAARRDVVRMIVGDGLRPVVLGAACGVALAIVALLSLPRQFARLIPAIDPGAMAIVPVLLAGFAGAAVLACYLPARRASRVDPNVALKEL